MSKIELYMHCIYNSIEGKFKVQHYPTKLLLLSTGTYIVIPNTEDYKALVDKYLEWEVDIDG